MTAVLLHAVPVLVYQQPTPVSNAAVPAAALPVGPQQSLVIPLLPALVLPTNDSRWQQVGNVH